MDVDTAEATGLLAARRKRRCAQPRFALPISRRQFVGVGSSDSVAHVARVKPSQVRYAMSHYSISNNGTLPLPHTGRTPMRDHRGIASIPIIR